MSTALIRDFAPDDAEGISNLFRQVYGDRYVYPEVYLPALIRYRNATGAWRSAVAHLDGVIVAHAALVSSPAMGDCAELALAAALPTVAGRGLGMRVCRHLCARAVEDGDGMLTALQVCSHVQSQRMGALLGIGTTGMLLDYLPSSFETGRRESYVLGCRALKPRPLPAIDWPRQCAPWITAMMERYGVQHAIRWEEQSTAPGDATGLDIRSDGALITFTLERLGDSVLAEAERLPQGRPTLLRLRATHGFAEAAALFAAQGYRHTGLMPAAGGGWYGLMQNGVGSPGLQLHCPLAGLIARPHGQT